MAPLPDYLQNATRVALCVGIACILGYGVILPWGSTTPGKTVVQYSQACKWAAITSVTIAQPVIGKLSQVGAERTIGTVAGGTLGYATFQAGKQFWQDSETKRDDGMVLSIAAAAVAFMGVWIGAKLKLDYSAKLFTMTFLLVTFGATQDDKGLLVMVTRILGICSGVLLSLLVSIFVFPRSASQEAIKETATALKALSELSSQVWAEGIRDNLKAPNATAPPAAVNRAIASLTCGMTAGHSKAEGEKSEGNSEQLCEEKLMVMYNALTKAAEYVGQSKGEIYCGAPRGRAFFFPGLPWWPAGRWRLPAADFEELSDSLKAMGRLLFNLHLAFDEGFDEELLAMLRQQYPGTLLPRLAAAAHGCLTDAVDAFPGRPFVSPGQLHRFLQSVEGLLAISDFQRRRVFQRLRPAQRQLTHIRTRRRRDGSALSPAGTMSPPPSMASRTFSGARRASFRERFTPVASPPEGTDHLATAAASKPAKPSGPPPAQSAGTAAAGPPASSPPGAPEALGAAEQRHPGRSPFDAFNHLPQDLHISIASEHGSAEVSPRDGNGWQQESLRAKQGELREQLSIRLQRVPSDQLFVFPDTAQGFVSQVRWYSFQFLVAEIAEELQELHDALGDLLFKLPPGVFEA